MIYRNLFLVLVKDRLALFSLFIVCLYSLVAMLTISGKLASDWQSEVGESYTPPSLERMELFLGTDILGRSVLYKSLKGIEIAMTIGLITAILAATIGVALGVAAGFYGGKVDEFVIWIVTIFSSIPHIMLLIAITMIPGKGKYAVFLALGITGWVGLCRLVRAEVMKHKNRDYVMSANAIGLSNLAIIGRHVLPNISHVIIINFSLTFQSAIKSEVILSYLGIGVQTISWGLMIDDSKQELTQGIWWQLFAATIFMFIIVLAFNILGDSLRDAMDPKLGDTNG
jgi:peptide/nickel transport system permease protein